MNGPSAEALAWLRLLDEGHLTENRSTARVCELARSTGWAEAAARSGEIVLREAHRAEIEDRLDHLWPSWRGQLEELKATGNPCTVEGWRRLGDARRREELPTGLPDALNRRTVAAALREHSKADVRPQHLGALGTTTMTHDNLLRLRPHAALRIQKGNASLAADEIANLCGEVCISDRGFRDGTQLAGAPPTAVLLVENLGVYIDVPLPAGWCAVHVPGWNTRMVTHVRDAWPETPACIFGDLDPNGVAIARALIAVWPGLQWFIPGFAYDYLPRAQQGSWPEDVGDVPAIVRVLVNSGRWLEQELFVLDARLKSELEQMLKVSGSVP